MHSTKSSPPLDRCEPYAVEPPVLQCGNLGAFIVGSGCAAAFQSESLGQPGATAASSACVVRRRLFFFGGVVNGVARFQDLGQHSLGRTGVLRRIAVHIVFVNLGGWLALVALGCNAGDN